MITTTNMSRRGLLAATGAALAAPGLALAQGRYPDRPIQLVVPWPAGGSADAQLRSISELVGKALGQPMVVQNRPGAGGTLGVLAVAQQAHFQAQRFQLRGQRAYGGGLAALGVVLFSQPLLQSSFAPLLSESYGRSEPRRFPLSLLIGRHQQSQCMPARIGPIIPHLGQRPIALAQDRTAG